MPEPFIFNTTGKLVLTLHGRGGDVIVIIIWTPDRAVRIRFEPCLGHPVVY